MGRKLLEIKITTKSAAETASLGYRLGELINSKCVIAFFGGMGSGKTCFTAGLCKGLDYNGDVNSPTFAIINEYLGGRFPIFHFDMYRIMDDDELYGIGFYDYLDQDGVMVIEWGENIDFAIPNDSIFIAFEAPEPNVRSITITYNGNDDFLKELKTECVF